MSDAAAVRIRPAATVVLLRDGADGLEVWLQQRATTLAFAAGMYAFPGGAVDPDDSQTAVPNELALQHAQVWLDGDSALAAAHLAAAARETFEESGVRLDLTTLVPWARWLTPPGESRRFDARFYIAPCPAKQAPRPLTGEVASGDWFVLRRAVEAYGAGSLPMWPPTISTLLELVPFDDVASATLAAPERIEVVAG
ncbi:MAG TPA: NUDIX domain-containing protein [Actinomycetes bacterium]|nr:NUDIX domain-containing protein [Actinomycetes bacterium]